MSFPVHLPAALGSAGTSSHCGPRSAGEMRPLCRSGPRQRISVETIYGHLITIDPGPSCAVATGNQCGTAATHSKITTTALAITGRSEFELAARSAGLPKLRFGVIRVIEDQITTLWPYNARYTGDPRSIFRKRYTEMITRVSLDLNGPVAYRPAEPVTLCDKSAVEAVSGLPPGRCRFSSCS